MQATTIHKLLMNQWELDLLVRYCDHCTKQGLLHLREYGGAQEDVTDALDAFQAIPEEVRDAFQYGWEDGDQFERRSN